MSTVLLITWMNNILLVLAYGLPLLHLVQNPPAVQPKILVLLLLHNLVVYVGAKSELDGAGE